MVGECWGGWGQGFGWGKGLRPQKQQEGWGGPALACSARGPFRCRFQGLSALQRLERPECPRAHSSPGPLTVPLQDPCPVSPHCQCHLVHQLHPALHPAQQCRPGCRGPHPGRVCEESGDGGSPLSTSLAPLPTWLQPPAHLPAAQSSVYALCGCRHQSLLKFKSREDQDARATPSEQYCHSTQHRQALGA